MPALHECTFHNQENIPSCSDVDGISASHEYLFHFYLGSDLENKGSFIKALFFLHEHLDHEGQHMLQNWQSLGEIGIQDRNKSVSGHTCTI